MFGRIGMRKILFYAVYLPIQIIFAYDSYEVHFWLIYLQKGEMNELVDFFFVMRIKIDNSRLVDEFSKL